MTCAVVPSSTGTATVVMTNSRETASRTSGSTNDSSIRKLAPAGSLPRQRSMPIANSAPRGTVINVAITPSLMVCSNAVCSAALCQTDSELSPQYQRNENPCHVVLERPSLNEYATAMITGSSDHAKYPGDGDEEPRRPPRVVPPRHGRYSCSSRPQHTHTDTSSRRE